MFTRKYDRVFAAKPFRKVRHIEAEKPFALDLVETIVVGSFRVRHRFGDHFYSCRGLGAADKQIPTVSRTLVRSFADTIFLPYA